MTKSILWKTLEVKMPLSKAGISSYLLLFSRLGVLIFFSLHISTTFLYSKGNLQSPSDVAVNKHPGNFKQKQPIARLFFSSKKSGRIHFKKEWQFWGRTFRVLCSGGWFMIHNTEYVTIIIELRTLRGSALPWQGIIAIDAPVSFWVLCVGNVMYGVSRS